MTIWLLCHIFKILHRHFFLEQVCKSLAMAVSWVWFPDELIKCKTWMQCKMLWMEANAWMFSNIIWDMSCFCRIQDIGILFNVIIILLMMFNTYVFQVGLVSLLLERFRALLILSALYLTLSICFHCWVMVCTRTHAHTRTHTHMHTHARARTHTHAQALIITRSYMGSVSTESHL